MEHYGGYHCRLRLDGGASAPATSWSCFMFKNLDEALLIKHLLGSTQEVSERSGASSSDNHASGFSTRCDEETFFERILQRKKPKQPNQNNVPRVSVEPKRPNWRPVKFSLREPRCTSRITFNVLPGPIQPIDGIWKRTKQ